MLKLTLWMLIGIVGFGYYGYYVNVKRAESNANIYLSQFDNTDESAVAVRRASYLNNNVPATLVAVWVLVGLYLGYNRMQQYMKRQKFLRDCGIAGMFVLAIMNAGCYRPFEPVQLETIGTNEEGFLIPWSGDAKKQVSTENEAFLKQNLVSTKQIRIPQQWVQSGYEWFGVPNGDWKPGATLIKVDKAPVTREWTAEKNRGTSQTDEAIWVMSADQVEFSTGWTCTARINTRDDAVKFLHNYPNGSLSNVLDHEVRAKLQADFSLEVTDLPMDELRKNATPHIKKVVAGVEKFFEERGINITNLGIAGGFVYKNPSIQERLVEVFNSEQEKNIALAKTQAQEQHNKTILLEAEGRAAAILKTRKAEADGIKMVADAKAYEIQKAKEDLNTYMRLKQLEVETKKVEKWTGVFPQMFMGDNKQGLNMLLQVPDTSTQKGK